jgi:hypothetical protein
MLFGGEPHSLVSSGAAVLAPLSTNSLTLRKLPILARRPFCLGTSKELWTDPEEYMIRGSKLCCNHKSRKIANGKSARELG